MPEEPLTETPLEYHVLLALGRGPLYGYAIARAVEEESGGVVAPRAGSLYRVIARLLDRGLLEETDAPEEGEETHPGRDRRYYGLTPSGRRAVRAEARRLRRTAELADRRLGLADGGES